MGDFKGDPNRLIGRFRLDPFQRRCDLAEVLEFGEYLVLDCYSARKFGSDSISMMVASDSTTRRILSTSRSAHPNNLALEGPQIADLASVRRHLASINR